MTRPRPLVAANPDSRDQKCYRRGDDGPGGCGGHGGGSGNGGGGDSHQRREETVEVEEARLVELEAREVVRILDEVAGAVAAALGAVSYTHLTLPTICSV